MQKADTDSVRASEVRDRDSRERLRLDMDSSMMAAQVRGWGCSWGEGGQAATNQAEEQDADDVSAMLVCRGDCDWFMEGGEEESEERGLGMFEKWGKGQRGMLQRSG